MPFASHSTHTLPLRPGADLANSTLYEDAALELQRLEASVLRAPPNMTTGAGADDDGASAADGAGWLPTPTNPPQVRGTRIDA